jgi:hypothetical protein
MAFIVALTGFRKSIQKTAVDALIFGFFVNLLRWRVLLVPQTCV